MKKIAIIGCGKIFLKHYEAIKIQEKKKKMRLVAVCDKNNTLLNQIKDKTINKYTNLNDLFKNEKLDIRYIPPDTSSAQGSRASSSPSKIAT